MKTKTSWTSEFFSSMSYVGLVATHFHLEDHKHALRIADADEITTLSQFPGKQSKQ
jgi:hypothetical protein